MTNIIDLNHILKLKKRLEAKKEAFNLLMENCKGILTVNDFLEISVDIQKMERALNNLKQQARS